MERCEGCAACRDAGPRLPKPAARNLAVWRFCYGTCWECGSD